MNKSSVRYVVSIQATDQLDPTLKWKRDFVGVGYNKDECREDAIWTAENLWGDDLEFEVLNMNLL